MENLGILQ